jgi:hypothetical protein
VIGHPILGGAPRGRPRLRRRLRRSSSSWTVALGLLLAASGCSGGNGGNGDNNGGSVPASVRDFLNELRDGSCDRDVRCGVLADRATCVELQYISETEVLTLEHDVAQGRVIFDPSQAPACVAAYRSLPCGGSEAFSAITMTAGPACISVLKGTAAEGAPCFFISECPQGSYCRPPEGLGSSAASCIDACCPGSTCTTFQGTLAEGASCKKGLPTLTPSELCGGDNHYCATGSRTGIDGVCQPQVTGEGSVCADYDSCRSPLVCVFDGGTGHCLHAVAEGGTCMSASGATTPCDLPRDFCDPTTKTCVRRHHVGEACTTTGQECEEAAYCDATTATCLARGSNGEACGGATAIPCRDAFVCDAASARCQPHPAGTVCQ